MAGLARRRSLEKLRRATRKTLTGGRTSQSRPQSRQNPLEPNRTGGGGSGTGSIGAKKAEMTGKRVRVMRRSTEEMVW